MNAIFFIFCSISLCLCLVFAPQKALPAMLEGANKSILLMINLLCVYCVWMGIYKILEESKISEFLATLLKKPVKKIFKTKSEALSKNVSMNLISNALGLGGIATPLGILACKQFEEENNLFGAKLLVVISSTSIQLLPTSVLSLISSFGGKNPENIILPSLICTLFSSALGVGLFLLKENFFHKEK